jgi:glycosyltransferase involved in cell wall biosynthesis
MESNLKVTLVSGSLPDMTCGVAEYTARLAEALVGAGAAVRVVTSRDERIDNAGRFQVVQATDDWGLRRLPGILRAVRFGRPDVIHLQYPSTGYRHGLAPGLLLPILRVLSPRLRLVATVHEYRHMRRLHKVYTAATMPWAHLILTPDRSQIAKMPLIGRRRVLEIPLTSNLRPGEDPIRAAAASDDLIVGTWGQLRHDKGIDQLLDAFELVAVRRPARLVIAGDPGQDAAYIREIDRRIASSPVRDRISRTGRLPDDQLVAALLTFDACVLPYRAGLEGNRGTYATATMTGLYTVTTSQTARGFDPANNTWFVAPGDVDALVEAILAAQEHPRHPPRDNEAAWASIAARHVAAYRGATDRQSVDVDAT